MRGADASAQESKAQGDAKAPGSASPNDEQSVRKASAAYLEALSKGELPARMAFWTDDADYIDASGKVTRGRDALTARFKEGLADLAGTKVTGQINSLKFLRPEVAIVDGTLEFTNADGSKDSNRYAVVWVKSGDRWLISSARDLPLETDDLPSLAFPQLRAIDWLVGEWRDASNKSDVRLNCRWAPNKTFLLMDYELNRTGEDPLLVTERIGWDGRNGMIRSWTFDSQGGFGEGYWEQEGNQWNVGAAGILPDGGEGGATIVYEFLDQDSFLWKSLDRSVDGQPVADSTIKFVRKAAAKEQGGQP
jgi:uncharacterized protein (TIGR02246 family)